MKLMHPDSSQEVETTPAAARLYLSQGWREISDDAPKARASLAAWQEYARSKGFTDEDLKGMTRADIRAALA